MDCEEIKKLACKHSVSVHLSYVHENAEAERRHMWCAETTSERPEYEFTIRSTVSAFDAMVKLALCLQRTESDKEERESDA